MKQKDHTACVTDFIIKTADKHRDEAMALIAQSEAKGSEVAISSANSASELVEKIYTLLEESSLAELNREERQRRNGEAIELIAICEARSAHTRILLEHEDHELRSTIQSGH
ncbi:hypothetical protein [Rhizobium sp. Root482]|uniref:hypothetical protein n=1 Tax=Rhizobium sp. Root482 TaxID=1736543 RepID=UPI0006FBB6E4|nr:hypothetical protein [Rhizobium sp. Root482]KQY26713.1 hypothetical protein ASD31_00425 [Rhizobium sp. Root482]